MRPVALESAGVSGRPRCERLERRGLAVLLVEPQQGQPLQGRPKRGVPAGPWRQRLQTGGLLAGALRPPAQGGGLRRSLRQRAMVRRSASQHLQPRHAALTQLNIQLQHAVSDVTGATGRASRRALRAGARAPGPGARRRPDRCHHAEEPSAKALHGPGREEPLVAVGQAGALEARGHEKVAACDRQLAAHLEPCAAGEERAAWPPVSRPRPRHRPQWDVRGSRPRLTGVALSAREGIAEPTALPIIRASGLALERWPPVPPLTSWRGLCPPPRGSGGTA